MALSIYSAEQLSGLPFLQDIDVLKREADSYKPLPKETEDRILQKFRLDWNYHSNAIEGNKLTYGETVAFIMEGLTAKGKPLKDHLDIKGHDEAVKFILPLVKDKDYKLTEADIRNLHKLILREPYWSDARTPEGILTQKEIQIGVYKSSSNSVRTPTGEMHYYATPEDTPIKMGELMAFYRDAKDNTLVHPLVLAALFHHEFTSIHPFDDGNGRMGRLLMNLMLMQAGYPPVVVKQQEREQYYQILRQADAGEYIPIIEYMSNLLQHSLTIYVKGAKGESIEEETDIDKEIALFKKGLGEDRATHKKTNELIERAVKESIVPLFNSLIIQLNKFEDLFIEVTRILEIKDNKRIEEIKLSKNGFDNIEFIFFQISRAIWNTIFETSESQTYNLTSFNLMLYFDGYKKSKEPISEALKYKINFEDYQYSISRTGDSTNYILKKAYGQSPTKEDINEICNKEVRCFLKTLQRYSHE